MRYIIFLGLLLTAAGCDTPQEVGQVSGKVTYRGEPLKFGTVLLQPATGGAKPALGKIQSDGTFTARIPNGGDGAALGRNLIQITAFEVENPDRDRNKTLVGTGKSYIPVVFTTFGSSGLEVDVQPGENPPLNIDLVD